MCASVSVVVWRCANVKQVLLVPLFRQSSVQDMACSAKAGSKLMYAVA